LKAISTFVEIISLWECKRHGDYKLDGALSLCNLSVYNVFRSEHDKFAPAILEPDIHRSHGGTYRLPQTIAQRSGSSAGRTAGFRNRAGCWAAGFNLHIRRSRKAGAV
jgi:hypothetical protein